MPGSDPGWWVLGLNSQENMFLSFQWTRLPVTRNTPRLHPDSQEIKTSSEDARRGGGGGGGWDGDRPGEGRAAGGGRRGGAGGGGGGGGGCCMMQAVTQMAGYVLMQANLPLPSGLWEMSKLSHIFLSIITGSFPQDACLPFYVFMDKLKCRS